MAELAMLTPFMEPAVTVLPQGEHDPRIGGASNAAGYIKEWNDFIVSSLKFLRNGQIEALTVDFAPLSKQLDQLKSLAVGWDGYDAPTPSADAIGAAKTLLQHMQNELLKPQRITPSAEGGVAFTFAATGQRRAQIELLNSGEKFAHLYDLNGDSRTEDWNENLEVVSIKRLLEPIRRYLQI
jgi:hypothetical protein